MCKIVYLTTRRFDQESGDFRRELAEELTSRGIEVVSAYAQDFWNRGRKHKTYGIALAFDFYKDGGAGCGLTLNKNCSWIGRDFAYNLSNDLDILTPNIAWRNFNFVTSDDKQWYRFFNKVSSSTKAIIHLCTANNPSDWENFSVARPHIIRLFADEIVRCLRSDYSVDAYRKNVRCAKLKYASAQRQQAKEQEQRRQEECEKVEGRG